MRCPVHTNLRWPCFDNFFTTTKLLRATIASIDLLQMKIVKFLLGFCLITHAVSAAEPIASFAKSSLALELGSLPFGTIPRSNGFAPTAAPLQLSLTNDASLAWMTNALSEKYHQEFPSRVLRFGLQGDEIVCIRISTSVFNPSGDNTNTSLDRRRADLIHIQESLLRVSPRQRMSFEDGAYSIRYSVSCSPETNSIFCQELEIAPVTRQKRP
jgi:hypothetical protein